MLLPKEIQKMYLDREYFELRKMMFLEQLEEHIRGNRKDEMPLEVYGQDMYGRELVCTPGINRFEEWKQKVYSREYTEEEINQINKALKKWEVALSFGEYLTVEEIMK